MYALLLTGESKRTQSSFSPMKKRMRILRVSFTLSILALLFAGCGGTKVTRTAKKEIRAAKSAFSAAEDFASQKEFGSALDALAEAKMYAKKGRKYGSSRDKRTLKGILERVSAKSSEYKLKKKKYDVIKEMAKLKQEEKDALAAAEAKANPGKEVAKIDPEQAMDPEKRAALAAAAKEKENKKKDNSDLDALDETDVPQTVENAPTPETTPTKVADVEVKDVPKEEIKDEGPYRPYGKDRPALSIDKVESKGEYALCYLQLFNKDPKMNKRIARVIVVFRTAGNGKIFEADLTVPFKSFDPNAKNLLEQNDALTLSSHEVFGGQTLKLVAILHSRVEAKNAAKAAVTIQYADGTSDSDTGPGSLVDPVKKKSGLPF